MKRKFTVLFILYLTLISCDCQNQNKDKEALKIWNNYLNTLGSYDINKSNKTFKDSAISVFNGDTLIQVSRIIYPDKINLKTYKSNGESNTIIVNGDKGVLINNDKKKKLTEESIDNYKNMGLIYPEYYFEKLGYKIKLVSTEIINKKPHYNIEITTKTDKLNYFISKDNYNFNEMTSGDISVEIIESMEINNISFVKKSKVTDKYGITYRTRIDAKLNAEINENYFKL